MAKTKSEKRQSAVPAESVEIQKVPIHIDQRIGLAIRKRRQALSLTLGDLSAGSEMSSAMISRIENAQAAASLEVLGRIASALGASLSAIFKEIEASEGTAQLVKVANQMEVVRTGTRHGHTYKLLSYHRGPRSAVRAVSDQDGQRE